jgi:hypothetical protein
MEEMMGSGRENSEKTNSGPWLSADVDEITARRALKTNFFTGSQFAFRVCLKGLFKPFDVAQGHEALEWLGLLRHNHPPIRRGIPRNDSQRKKLFSN